MTNVAENAFYSFFLFFNCRFGNKYDYRAHVPAQALYGNVIFIQRFIRLLSWDLGVTS